MGIKWGEDYRGAGRADPGKTRAERQQELMSLLRTPAGLLMVQAILNREYPNG
jgi:hypothetical protein